MALCAHTHMQSHWLSAQSDALIFILLASHCMDPDCHYIGSSGQKMKIVNPYYYKREILSVCMSVRMYVHYRLKNYPTNLHKNSGQVRILSKE